MKSKKYLVGDFETTVYDGQTSTEVWASACVEMYTENVYIFHSIDEQFKYLVSLDSDIVMYYHNLKFDGSFWLSYLLCDLKYKQAYSKLTDDAAYVKWKKVYRMDNESVQYSISDKGQWYTITIKVNDHIIELRDSLKLLPFSVKKLGEGFKTKHRKLDMEYKGYRYAGCEITDEEKKYIRNDVLVVKEALEFMYSENHNKLTIGSCCLEEFRHKFSKDEYSSFFPNLYDIELDPEKYGSKTAGDYIRKSYHGGWCYVVKGKENRVFTNGTTADVNSLYPSMMHSESGNYYPVGKPTFFDGWEFPFIRHKGEPIKLKDGGYTRPNPIFWFVRVKTRFKIKPGQLPCIQIKGLEPYNPREWLDTSDVKCKSGQYATSWMDDLGNWHDTRIEMTLTMTDFNLLIEHYNTTEFEVLDGCYFRAETGIFDDYINKYKEIKMNSKGAMRELAKLFLNNLYGKMASSTSSSFKVAEVRPDGSLGFYTVTEFEKQPGYIPIGSAITSYARNFTIRAAQLNYHGIDEPGFIYADTDSIHCDLSPNELKGIKADDTAFCCWKLESCWDISIFARQKTYIEHITHENLVPVESTTDKNGNSRQPYYSVKCAGMPDACKDLFIKSLEGYQISDADEYSQEAAHIINAKYKITDFKIGLELPGKLLPKRIPGGVLLVDTYYQMR